MSQTNNKLDMSGDPVGVSLITEPLTKCLQLASQTGVAKLSDSSELDWKPLFRLDPIDGCSFVYVLIVNSLPTPLRLVQSWLDSGSQANYPGVVDSNLALDGPAHEIPAKMPHPANPSVALTGAGAYRFVNENMFGDVNGALAFSYKKGGAGPLIGVAFRNHASSLGVPTCAVTADLSSYGNSLSTFYHKTADVAPGAPYEIGAETTIWGMLTPMSGAAAAFGGDSSCHLHVWVRDLST